MISEQCKGVLITRLESLHWADLQYQWILLSQDPSPEYYCFRQYTTKMVLPWDTLNKSCWLPISAIKPQTQGIATLCKVTGHDRYCQIRHMQSRNWRTRKTNYKMQEYICGKVQYPKAAWWSVPLWHCQRSLTGSTTLEVADSSKAGRSGQDAKGTWKDMKLLKCPTAPGHLLSFSS